MLAPRPLRLLTALLLLLASGTVAAAGAGAGWTISVVPIMPAVEIKRRWQPVLDQVARDSGLTLRLRFHEDFASFEQAMARGESDFVVASAVQTWRLRQVYRPVLRGRIPLTGLVVVRHDSPWQQLADLDGQVLCLQAGNEISSNLLVLQTLREQKLNVTLNPLNTESSALRSVVRGKSDAAIINNYLMGLSPPDIAARLRIIHRTVDLPPPAISASLRIPPETVEKFRRSLLRLRETHPALLDAVLMSDLIEADLQRDYGNVGKLIPPEAGNATP